MPVQPDQRQDRAAVLDDLAAADLLDGVGADLLQPGDRVQRDGHPAPAADARRRSSAAGSVLGGRGGCGGVARASWPRSAVSVRSARRARACTSRISATVPSPRMVAPAYRPIAFSWPPSGLTTISSVLMHPVDDQAEPAALGLQHGDDDVAVVPLGRSAPSTSAQAHQRQQLAAQPVDRRAADVLDRRRRACSASEARPARAG